MKASEPDHLPTPEATTSRPAGIAALVLAALVAGGWGYWYTQAQTPAAGPSVQTQIAPASVGPLGFARANSLQMADPNARPMSHNPLGLATPVTEAQPLRFARTHGGFTEEVAMFIINRDNAPAVMNAWINQLNSKGWTQRQTNPPSRGATSGPALLFVRNDRAPSKAGTPLATVQIQSTPRMDRYHHLLLVYRYPDRNDKPQ